MTRGRVLLDVMLGKLATYLRMCRYDAVYAQEEGIEADDAIRALADEENRTLLTRDRELAARTEGAILLEGRDVEKQLAELADVGFDLSIPETPTRCSVCNGSVEVASLESPPDYVAGGYDEYWQCRDCGQYFRKGSHWERVEQILASVGQH